MQKVTSSFWPAKVSKKKKFFLKQCEVLFCQRSMTCLEVEPFVMMALKLAKHTTQKFSPQRKPSSDLVKCSGTEAKCKILGDSVCILHKSNRSSILHFTFLSISKPPNQCTEDSWHTGVKHVRGNYKERANISVHKKHNVCSATFHNQSGNLGVNLNICYIQRNLLKHLILLSVFSSFLQTSTIVLGGYFGPTNFQGQNSRIYTCVHTPLVGGGELCDNSHDGMSLLAKGHCSAPWALLHVLDVMCIQQGELVQFQKMFPTFVNMQKSQDWNPHRCDSHHADGWACGICYDGMKRENPACRSKIKAEQMFLCITQELSWMCFYFSLLSSEMPKTFEFVPVKQGSPVPNLIGLWGRIKRVHFVFFQSWTALLQECIKRTSILHFSRFKAKS